MTNTIAIPSDFDTLWINARIATMATGLETGYGLIDNAAIATKGENIIWVGGTRELGEFGNGNGPQGSTKIVDCEGALITPGLIDCHTHLVYAGNRINEFELRMNGASYADISAAGGGIASTVAATRAASEDELFISAKHRIDSFLAEGVTTIEIKSGYGLDLANEQKMLRVARRLGDELPVDVTTTFLGAHSIPPEFSNNTHTDADAYIDLVCNEMIPAVAKQKLADSVDAFCENIAFNTAQVKRVFEAAQQHGLAIKLHAEQLSDQHGAVLAASMGALSVDHIEFLQTKDVATLKANDTVAVLLPGAFYFLRETQLPPIEELRAQRVPMAVASDSNPGSSPVRSLLLMLSMACTFFKLTPAEALAGVTVNAAKALGISDKVGTLEVGKTANFVIWNVNDPAELSYAIGGNPCKSVVYRGGIR